MAAYGEGAQVRPPHEARDGAPGRPSLQGHAQRQPGPYGLPPGTGQPQVATTLHHPAWIHLPHILHVSRQSHQEYEIEEVITCPQRGYVYCCRLACEVEEWGGLASEAAVPALQPSEVTAMGVPPSCA